MQRTSVINVFHYKRGIRGRKRNAEYLLPQVKLHLHAIIQAQCFHKLGSRNQVTKIMPLRTRTKVLAICGKESLQKNLISLKLLLKVWV